MTAISALRPLARIVDVMAVAAIDDEGGEPIDVVAVHRRPNPDHLIRLGRRCRSATEVATQVPGASEVVLRSQHLVAYTRVQRSFSLVVLARASASVAQMRLAAQLVMSDIETEVARHNSGGATSPPVTPTRESTPPPEPPRRRRTSRLGVWGS